MQIYLMGTVEVDGHTYTMADAKAGSLKMPAAHGLADSFYGGRAKWIADDNKNKGIFLVVEDNSGLRVIDIFMKTIEEASIATLRYLAKRFKFELKRETKKEELVAFLSGLQTARPAPVPTVERIE